MRKYLLTLFLLTLVVGFSTCTMKEVENERIENEAAGSTKDFTASPYFYYYQAAKDIIHNALLRLRKNFDRQAYLNPQSNLTIINT